MSQDVSAAPVQFTVSAVEVLRRFGLPETWRCRSAEYVAETDSIRLTLTYPLVAVDGQQSQVFVEGDYF